VIKRLSAVPGLRARLTAWVAAVLVVSAAVIFVVVYQDTGSRLRAQIDRDVTGAAMQFKGSLAASSARTAPEILAAARRAAAAQPFSQASTLLYAFIPGVGSTSNHPDVFNATRPEARESTTDQRQENTLAHGLLLARTGLFTQPLPDVGGVRGYETATTIHGVRVYVGAGQPLQEVTRAQEGVARAFVLAGALTLILALIASYAAGAHVSAPLRRMAAVAARVDAGDLAPRMHVDESASTEVRVLAEAFNHMLDRLADAFAGQREFVADASHELRTPLTVIRGQLEILAVQEHPDGDEVRRVERLVQAEVARVTRLVEDLLLLAQSERSDFLRVEPVELARFIPELWAGITVTANRRFELSEVPNATLAADPDRLAQALRNLIRNAIEHTEEPDGLVRLEVSRPTSNRLCFAVMDDGPGIPPSERDRIFERFHRTDPSRSRALGGAGLGLAIVHAIAEAHRGSVRAVDSPAGGARVELELPGVWSDATRLEPVAVVR
jgi:signal transduction histidine kinase